MLVQVGKVLKPHGYKGSFTVSNDAGKTSVLGTAPSVFLGSTEASAKEYKVLEAAWMPKAWKLTLQGVESEEEANTLRNLFVYVHRRDLPATQPGEYYVSDLVGLEGIDEATGESIGIFSHLQEIQGPNEKVVQQTWFFKTEKGIEKEIPGVSHFIAKVDAEKKKIFLKNLKELEEE